MKTIADWHTCHGSNKEWMCGVNPQPANSQGRARTDRLSLQSPVTLEPFCGFLTGAAKVKELANFSNEILLLCLALLGRSS